MTGGEAPDHDAAPDLLKIPASKPRQFLAHKDWNSDLLGEAFWIHGIKPRVERLLPSKAVVASNPVAIPPEACWP